MCIRDRYEIEFESKNRKRSLQIDTLDEGEYLYDLHKTFALQNL